MDHPKAFRLKLLSRARYRFSDRRSDSLSFLLVALLTLLCSASSVATSDSDADLVPDFFDNCTIVANGPNEASNQIDSDLDGYGNACDADYNNDFQISAFDYGILIDALTEPGGPADHDGNGVVTITDFAEFLEDFQMPNNTPGPSGLVCAGTVPCTP